jgi:hypothetical protein
LNGEIEEVLDKLEYDHKDDFDDKANCCIPIEGIYERIRR